MNTRELGIILGECRRLFPREYERWSAIHPQRIVMLKFVAVYPEQMLPIIRFLFADSDEYREACNYITETLETVYR
jgi:hypothetical protein